MIVDNTDQFIKEIIEIDQQTPQRVPYINEPEQGDSRIFLILLLVVACVFVFFKTKSGRRSRPWFINRRS